MKKFKILFLLIIMVLVLGGCDLKININSDEGQKDIEVKVDENEEQEVTEDDTKEDEVIIQGASDYEIITDEEGMVTQIKMGEVMIEDLAEFCGQEVMVYAQPESQELVVFVPFNPGSDKPADTLLAFKLKQFECNELESSAELSNFGARVLSADQTKLAIALETDEAKVLKLIDLINDKVITLVELAEGETLNGGYGALSNHFDIKWLDNKMVQYTVFADTVVNYSDKAVEGIEDVIQVRVVDVE
jgi:hypothetical protein